MPENDTRVWLDVPAAELCFNHVGCPVKIVQGGYTIEGKLSGVTAIKSTDSTHLAVVIVMDETHGAQVEFEGTETVQIKLGGDAG